MSDLSTPKRQKFQTREFLLRSEIQVATLLALIPHLPLDADHPLSVRIGEQVKVRGLDANARMWAGPLTDIAAQAWVAGRQYSAEVWHHQFKTGFLPEEYDPELTKEGYRKWDYTPAGDRVLVGSTTQLTKRGFAQYLEQVEAFGAGLGVMFSAPKGRE